MYMQEKPEARAQGNRNRHVPMTKKNEEKSSTPSPSPGPARPMIDVILESLEEAKAQETISIDMEGKSPMSDFMVVTSGRSQRHVGAVADQLTKALKQSGHKSPRIEGLPNCDWVLLDAGDVIVHIFRPEVREFYNIEKMWQGDPAPSQ